MSSAEQQVRAAFGGPDLWLKDDGRTMQGYGATPGAGPWWSAESILARMAPPTEGVLTVRENGEANSYALVQNGDWLLSVLMNGQLLTDTQRATLHKLAAAWNEYERAGWIHVSDRLPECRKQVLAGYWYRDTWLKGDPWAFSVGICSMYEKPNDSCFPQGKRWQTHGCSHSAITHWRELPEFPPIPQELQA